MSGVLSDEAPQRSASEMLQQFIAQIPAAPVVECYPIYVVVDTGRRADISLDSLAELWTASGAKDVVVVGRSDLTSDKKGGKAAAKPKPKGKSEASAEDQKLTEADASALKDACAIRLVEGAKDLTALYAKERADIIAKLQSFDESVPLAVTSKKASTSVKQKPPSASGEKKKLSLKEQKAEAERLEKESKAAEEKAVAREQAKEDANQLVQRWKGIEAKIPLTIVLNDLVHNEEDTEALQKSGIVPHVVVSLSTLPEGSVVPALQLARAKQSWLRHLHITEVPLIPAALDKEGLANFASTVLQSIASARSELKAFQQWGAGAQRIQIPDEPDQVDCRLYQHLSSCVPEAAADVISVLHAMLLQVEATATDSDADKVLENEAGFRAPSADGTAASELLGQYLQDALEHTTAALGEARAAQSVKSEPSQSEVAPTQAGAVVLAQVDEHAVALACEAANGYVCKNSSVQTSEAALRQSLPLPGIGVLAKVRQSRPDAATRGAERTRLFNSSNLQAAHLEHAIVLHQLEQLLNEYSANGDCKDGGVSDAPREWKLPQRVWREELGVGESLASTIRAAADMPCAVSRGAYLPQLDKYVLTVHSHTPLSRSSTEVWDERVSSDVRFSTWINSDTSVKNSRPTRLYNLEGDGTGSGRIRVERTTLFPQDQGLLGLNAHVRFNKYERESGRVPQLWLSKDRHWLTLDSTSLVAQIPEGGRFVRTPDGGCSFTTNQGAHSSVLPTGDVLLQPPPSVTVDHSSSGERSRTVGPDGCVTRLLADGSREILRANGGVELISNDGSSRTITRADGSRVRLVNQGHEVREERLESVQVSEQVDPESQAVVAVRADLSLAVRYVNGDCFVQHADGTRVFTEHHKLTVEAPHYPRINFTCVGEAQEAWAVELSVADHWTLRRDAVGTVSLVDSRCATVVPRLLVAADGRGVFVPRGVSDLVPVKRYVELFATGPHAQQGNDSLSVQAALDKPKGLYFFRVEPQACALETTDPEENTFSASTADGGWAHAVLARHKGVADIGTGDAQGGTKQDSKAQDIGFDFIPAEFYPPPSNCLPPRLFVVEGDTGRGYELLEDAEVRHLQQQGQLQHQQGEKRLIVQDDIQEPNGGTHSVRVLHQAAGDAVSSCAGYSRIPVIPNVLKALQYSIARQTNNAAGACSNHNSGSSKQVVWTYRIFSELPRLSEAEYQAAVLELQQYAERQNQVAQQDVAYARVQQESVLASGDATVSEEEERHRAAVQRFMTARLLQTQQRIVRDAADEKETKSQPPAGGRSTPAPDSKFFLPNDTVVNRAADSTLSSLNEPSAISVGTTQQLSPRRLARLRRQMLKGTSACSVAPLHAGASNNTVGFRPSTQTSGGTGGTASFSPDGVSVHGRESYFEVKDFGRQYKLEQVLLDMMSSAAAAADNTSPSSPNSSGRVEVAETDLRQLLQKLSTLTETLGRIAVLPDPSLRMVDLSASPYTELMAGVQRAHADRLLSALGFQREKNNLWLLLRSDAGFYLSEGLAIVQGCIAQAAGQLNTVSASHTAEAQPQTPSTKKTLHIQTRSSSDDALNDGPQLGESASGVREIPAQGPASRKDEATLRRAVALGSPIHQRGGQSFRLALGPYGPSQAHSPMRQAQLRAALHLSPSAPVSPSALSTHGSFGPTSPRSPVSAAAEADPASPRSRKFTDGLSATAQYGAGWGSGGGGISPMFAAPSPRSPLSSLSGYQTYSQPLSPASPSSFAGNHLAPPLSPSLLASAQTAATVSATLAAAPAPGTGRSIYRPSVPSLAMGVPAAPPSPNERHLHSDDSARSGLKLSSTYRAAALPGAGMASFTMQPDRLSFGTLEAHKVYRITACLTNTGNFLGHFRVLPCAPTASVSLRVLHRPGPVAPGMQLRLEIECVSRAAGPFYSEIVIETEREVFRLPVEAEVLPEGATLGPPLTDKRLKQRLYMTPAATTQQHNKVKASPFSTTVGVHRFGEVGRVRCMGLAPVETSTGIAASGLSPAEDAANISGQLHIVHPAAESKRQERKVNDETGSSARKMRLEHKSSSTRQAEPTSSDWESGEDDDEHVQQPQERYRNQAQPQQTDAVSQISADGRR